MMVWGNSTPPTSRKWAVLTQLSWPAESLFYLYLLCVSLLTFSADFSLLTFSADFSADFLCYFFCECVREWERVYVRTCASVCLCECVWVRVSAWLCLFSLFTVSLCWLCICWLSLLNLLFLLTVSAMYFCAFVRACVCSCVCEVPTIV